MDVWEEHCDRREVGKMRDIGERKEMKDGRKEGRRGQKREEGWRVGKRGR